MSNYQYNKYREGLIKRHITCSGRYLSEIWLKEFEPKNDDHTLLINERVFKTPQIVDEKSNEILQESVERTYIPWISEDGVIYGGGDNPLLRGGIAMASFAIEYMIEKDLSSLTCAEKLLEYFERCELRQTGFFQRCRNILYTEEIGLHASVDELSGLMLGLYYLFLATENDQKIINSRVKKVVHRIANHLKKHGYLLLSPVSYEFHRGATGPYFFQYAFERAFLRITGLGFSPSEDDYNNAARKLIVIINSPEQYIKYTEIDDAIVEIALMLSLWIKLGHITDQDTINRGRYHISKAIDKHNIILGESKKNDLIIRTLEFFGITENVLATLIQSLFELDKSINISGVTIQEKDFRLPIIRYLMCSQAFQIQLNTYGPVGDYILDTDWTKGWSTVEFYEVGGNTYLFLLKEEGLANDGNNVHIHKMISDVLVGSKIASYKWEEGWTQAKPLKVGNQLFLFLLKKGNGHVNIRQINTDYTYGDFMQDTKYFKVDPKQWYHPIGTVFEAVRYNHDWTRGWSTVEFYEVGGNTYLFLLKEEGLANDGNNVHIHKMNSNGSVGSKIASYKWTGGWTQAKPFKVGNQLYLFLLKKGSGRVNIHRINTDGTVGDYVMDEDWTGGWSTVELYQTGGDTYLFLLKFEGVANDGNNVHIHKMNSDGSVGSKIWNDKWKEGWTQAKPFKVGNQLFIFLLKKGNGHVNIHRIAFNKIDNWHNFTMYLHTIHYALDDRMMTFNPMDKLIATLAYYMIKGFMKEGGNDFYAAVIARGKLSKYLLFDDSDYFPSLDAIIRQRRRMWDNLPVGELKHVRDGDPRCNAPKVRWHNSNDASEARIGMDFCWERNTDAYRILSWGDSKHDKATGLDVKIIGPKLTNGVDVMLEAGGLDYTFPYVLMGLWLNHNIEIYKTDLKFLRGKVCLPFQLNNQEKLQDIECKFDYKADLSWWKDLLANYFYLDMRIN